MAKDLRANININAKANGFAKVGAELRTLGRNVQYISDASAKFLKESAETYRGYEDNMLTVRAVLNSTSKSATEITRQMNALDKAAQTWAASTIFNTSDVSAAMVDAARAGWDYEKIMVGIPNVMHMAQAAGMSLADAMAYFVPIMNATGTEFADGSLLIDKWVQAANNAPTTVSEIGEAVKNLGAMSQLFASDTEMFTFLDMLAQNGVVGSQAGTVLRNMIARLYAPTKIAGEAMEELGLDLESVLETGESLTSAEEALNEMGLSAYDAEGNMRPLLDIFKDLSTLMKGKSEEEMNTFMKTVFGTKQFAGALTLLKSVQGGYDDLFTSIESAAGSAEKAGDIMTSGLTGSIMALESKWEEFQLQIGEKFAPTIEAATAMLGGVIDGLNGLSSEQLGAITGAMEGLAAIAPILLTAGGLSTLTTPLGQMSAALVVASLGAGALAGYLGEISKAGKEGLFGDVTIDTDTLNKYLDNQETVYSFMNKMLADGNEDIQKSAEAALETTQTLNEKMFTYVVGAAILNDSQKEQLKGLGKQLTEEVLGGIKSAQETSAKFTAALFGSDSLESALTNSWYTELYGEAESIGQNIRKKIAEGLEGDDTLDADEMAAVQAEVQRLMAIEAMIQNAKSETDYNAAALRAQNISWESANDFIGEQSAKYIAERAAIEKLYSEQYGGIMTSWDYYENNPEKSFLFGGKTYTLSDFQKEYGVTKDTLANDYNRVIQLAYASTDAKYGDLASVMIQSLIQSSGSPELWDLLKNGIDGVDFAAFSDDQLRDMQGMTAYINEIKKLFSGSTFADEAIGIFDNYSGIVQAIEGVLTSRGFDENVSLDDMAKNMKIWEEMQNEKLLPDGGAQASTYLQEAQAELDDEDLVATVTIKTVGGITSTPGSWGKAINKSGLVGALDNNIDGMFAEGGRATEASIFGEAGAEWAIPEEHTKRTADLLNAAREASGFTWGELLSRNGGLNAGGGNNLTITYSPTVNANDASGVESVLQKDKRNLKKIVEEMLEDFGMRNVAGAYV